jgi:uncharacterized damage-inducible protein DinB
MLSVAPQEWWRRLLWRRRRITTKQFEEFGGVWAEWIWLQRWKGVSPRTVFQATDFPILGAVRVRWLEVEAEQRAFRSRITNEQLLTVVRYANLTGQTWEYPLWRQMCHVVNHSSYHRGQLTTMLRQLGAQPLPTDLLVFADEQGSQLA